MNEQNEFYVFYITLTSNYNICFALHGISIAIADKS